MYRRILVPLDGGPRGAVALTVAQRLSPLWDAHIDVVGLAETEGTLAAMERAIERQTAHLGANASVAVRVAVHAIAEEIEQAIGSTSSTLVVMATSARGRSAAVIDSIADAVLRVIDGPALLIGPNAVVPPGWPQGPLFICTDGSALAEAIVPHAADVARGLELDPWFVTVTEPADVGAARPEAETDPAQQLALDFGPLLDGAVRCEQLQGTHPARDILAHARANGAGLIALATHGRTGLERLTLGSVAMQVVREAEVPVLVSRPRW